MRRRLFAMVMVVVMGTACASAPRTRSFQDLPQYIHTGSRVKLTDTTGLMTKGRLQTLSPTSLTILSGVDARDVPKSHVTKIERPERWIGRGALIGLGVGFGVGLLWGGSVESSGSPYVDTQAATASVAAGMLLGTAVGVILGAVVKVNRTVYVAPIPPVPVSQSCRSSDHTSDFATALASRVEPGCR